MSIYENQTKEEKRRTTIAVVLSVVVVTVGFMIQNLLAPPPQATQTIQTTVAPSALVQPGSPVTSSPIASSPAVSAAPVIPATPVPAKTSDKLATETVPAQVVIAKENVTIHTDLFEAVLSNAGGEIVSLKLKKHKDKEGFVDLIVPEAASSDALSVAFGPVGTPAMREPMQITWLDAEKKTVEFSRTLYTAATGTGEPVPFTYKKAYIFRDGEYMFGMAVTLENSRNENLPLNQGGFAYTITMGPQIGPRFDNRPKNADFRHAIVESGGKKKQQNLKPGAPLVVKDQATWAALSGKYFTFIAIPELSVFQTAFAQGNDPTIKQTNSMYISRPAIAASRQTDSFYFYFGPKTASVLSRYDYADRNGFQKVGLRLEDAMNNTNMLGWLENVLKFFLNLFHRLIPNYGIAIILTTILVRALMFPLTKQQSTGSARMQELQPQMAEIQAKYKGNPQKLNQELAEFYKREKYNPMSGCLPLLIQFPIFIAMYNLFNNHFDLRGAMFIAGWVPDLSMPENFISFGNFVLPVLGWTDLRALPIVYLASQLLYGKFTQTPATGQNASQMKFMMFGMPIMFFFILYDVPSGLLIYWIANNLLTIGQQIVINDMLKKRKAHAKAGIKTEAPKIAPVGKKR